MIVSSTMSDATRWIRHTFHELNPASRRKAARWDETGGIEFLRMIGLKKGDVMVDFGCGPGMFSVPAARMVGAEGRVYAVDKNPRVLRKVRRKAAAQGLRNLQTAGVLDDPVLRAENRRCNIILLYDMLHFLDLPQRRSVYAALHGLLADNGLLSVHLKHVRGDEPGWYFAKMTAEDAVREIESSGYVLIRRISTCVWHGHDTGESVIWHFGRRRGIGNEGEKY